MILIVDTVESGKISEVELAEIKFRVKNICFFVSGFVSSTAFHFIGC